jgi:STE24 endopeptidase
VQLLVLLLIIGVLLADAGVGSLVTPVQGWLWLPPLVAFGPPLVGLLIELVLVRRTLREASAGSIDVIVKAGRRLRFLQWVAVLSSVVAVLGFGWLELLRSWMGNLVVIDELLAIIPGLVMVCLLWVVQWPIERLVRESLVIRRLDRGLPVHPVPTALEYLLVQVRIHLMVVLVPVLFVLGCVEISEVVVTRLLPPELPEWAGTSITGAASLMALALSPLGVVHAVNARTMSSGPLRSSLESILAHARVRVGDIRLWPTGGSILNGAVIGLIPRFRFVLLTDALLETLPRMQLRAVMAHEVGHLRFRHLPWTAVSLISMVWLFGQLMDWLAQPVFTWMLQLGVAPDSAVDLIQMVGTGVVMVCTFIGFGLVSRRFELQADAAAAAELSCHPQPPAPVTERIETHGAQAMCDALESVAQLNGIDPRRHTWRHGSIRWRQLHLQGLIGERIDRLPIDRQVRSIKLTLLVLLLLLASYAWWDVVSAETADGPDARGDDSFVEVRLGDPDPHGKD